MKRLLILLLSFLTAEGFACMCNKVTAGKLFRQADYVLIGKAVKNLNPEEATAKYLDYNGSGGWITFEVEKVLKGDITNKTVAIIQDGNSCSVLFILGQRYLVFGYHRDKIYTVNPDIEVMNHDPIDTRTTEQKRLGDEDDKLRSDFEKKVIQDYGILIDTDVCSTFYDGSTQFKKYMNR